MHLAETVGASGVHIMMTIRSLVGAIFRKLAIPQKYPCPLDWRWCAVPHQRLCVTLAGQHSRFQSRKIQAGRGLYGENAADLRSRCLGLIRPPSTASLFNRKICTRAISPDHRVMGGNYPGAGITLGPNRVFGYITARHIAGLPVWNHAAGAASGATASAMAAPVAPANGASSASTSPAPSTSTSPSPSPTPSPATSPATSPSTSPSPSPEELRHAA